jgi:hypothetical protein
LWEKEEIIGEIVRFCRQTASELPKSGSEVVPFIDNLVAEVTEELVCDLDFWDRNNCNLESNTLKVRWPVASK